MNRVLLFLAFGYAVLIISCDKGVPKKSPEMEALEKQVNSIRNSATEAQAKHLMDSGFAALTSHSRLDIYFYYEFYNWYHQHRSENVLALRYADSMLQSLNGLVGAEDLLVHALVTKGIALKSLNRYPEALQSFYAANVLLKSIPIAVPLQRFLLA